jgi:hypothetical protein
MHTAWLAEGVVSGRASRLSSMGDFPLSPRLCVELKVGPDEAGMALGYRDSGQSFFRPASHKIVLA